jgi:hypothetical protein
MAKHTCDYCGEPNSVADDSPGFRATDASIFKGWASSLCESCCEFAQKKGFDITKLAERKRLSTAFRPQDFKGYRKQWVPQSGSAAQAVGVEALPQTIPAPKAIETPQRPQARLKKWVKLFALGGLLIGLLGSAFTPDTETTVGLWVFCSPPIIMLLICASNRCPDCKAWWSVDEVGRKNLETYMTTKSVTRKKERRDAKGQLIHTETWKEDVPVEMAVDRVTFRCKYCQKVHTQKQKHEV